MPTIKELRLRIKSLKNMGKITSAMKMVSAAKLKKSMDAFNASKPYAQSMDALVGRVLSGTGDIESPFLKEQESGITHYFIVTSDRGLCGSFNNGLLRYFTRLEKKGDFAVAGVGRRAHDFLTRTQVKAISTDRLPNTPNAENARALSKMMLDAYLAGKTNRVVLVYNNFKSVISQTPTCLQILPLVPSAAEVAANSEIKKTSSDDKLWLSDYIIEPNAEEVSETLIPTHIFTQILKVLLENASGEHGARMSSMDNSTKNIGKLIESLTLKMNRARQASITSELIEIISGASAIQG